MKYHEQKFYEDNKCLITKDSYQFIVRAKPIDPVHPYRGATYITDSKNLVWELCKCRKFYQETSGEVQRILELLKLKEGASECPSAT